MALGGFGRSGRTVDQPNQNLEPTAPTRTGAVPGYEFDHEGQDEKGRKMSRIAAPGAVSDADSQISVGKQMELEASNSIKYRTCSWQKVRSSPCFS